MKLQSKFALLDVKRGRVGLRKKLVKAGAEGALIPVVIYGRIVRCWGADDGVSQEFEVEVDSVEVGA